MSKKSGWEDLSTKVASNEHQHLSFDFWRTIAFSNSKFKLIRAELILNASLDKSSIEIVNEAFSEIGKEYNRNMELNNKIIAPFSLYNKVFQELNVPMNQWSVLYDNINESFLRYPPVIGDDFENLRSELKKSNASKSITSNTAFVSGELIKIFLDREGLGDLFSFMLFSDQVKSAKPNKIIFNLITDNLHSRKLYFSGISILHIGDNRNTDYFGAIEAGIYGLKIEDNESR